jgi:hypothetical protein
MLKLFFARDRLVSPIGNSFNLRIMGASVHVWCEVVHLFYKRLFLRSEAFKLVCLPALYLENMLSSFQLFSHVSCIPLEWVTLAF